VCSPCFVCCSCAVCLFAFCIVLCCCAFCVLFAVPDFTRTIFLHTIAFFPTHIVKRTCYPRRGVPRTVSGRSFWLGSRGPQPRGWGREALAREDTTLDLGLCVHLLRVCLCAVCIFIINPSSSAPPSQTSSGRARRKAYSPHLPNHSNCSPQIKF
jgi:hypothetical protein